MATQFELWLRGPDPQHLRAVGQAAVAELQRLELLLSRHDPAAELYRVNQEAKKAWTRIDKELYQVLKDCLQWERKTDGVFNIARPTTNAAIPLHRAISLHPSRTEVRIRSNQVRLDLGGYGKGYALDCMGAIMEEFGVKHFFMQGGTSSALAKGKQENGKAWQIGIQTDNMEQPVFIPLQDQGFSASEKRCAVLAPDASSGEVYSTVCAQAGKSRAVNYLSHSGLQLRWLDAPQIALTHPFSSTDQTQLS
jgi:thiamine biosynthesis lipoprotein